METDTSPDRSGEDQLKLIFDLGDQDKNGFITAKDFRSLGNEHFGNIRSVYTLEKYYAQLMGLATMAIGIWAKVNDRIYLEITNNQSIAQFSNLLIIIGLFIMIVGAVGAIGAIFGNTIFGRITLGLCSVVLALLVICEITTGIAAAIKRNDLETIFRSGAKDTFIMRNGTGVWNNYESQLHCCGVTTWKSYRELLNISIVPQSCCNPANKTLYGDCIEDNSPLRKNIAEDNPGYIFNTGCVDVLVDGGRLKQGVIAGGAIVLGLFQIAGIVMAYFVAVYKRDDNKCVVEWHHNINTWKPHVRLTMQQKSYDTTMFN